MADFWRFIPSNASDGSPWSEEDLSVWHDLLGDHVADIGAIKPPLSSEVKNTILLRGEVDDQKKQMENMISKDVYKHDIAEVKKQMEDALKLREEETSRLKAQYEVSVHSTEC